MPNPSDPDPIATAFRKLSNALKDLPPADARRVVRALAIAYGVIET